jgi:hypothetical protein
LDTSRPLLTADFCRKTLSAVNLVIQTEKGRA